MNAPRRRLASIFAALLAAGALSGCMAHAGHAGVIVAAPVHAHSPTCGHFWGWWSGYPVYFHGGSYTYWDGGTWVMLSSPPVVYYRQYHYAPRYGHVYGGHGHGHRSYYGGSGHHSGGSRGGGGGGGGRVHGSGPAKR